MVYLRARWYDATVGRFTSPDPVAPHLSYPQSINAYVYVLNNPVNYTDPSGLCAIAGTTDCEKFIAEIRGMIEGLQRGARTVSPLAKDRQ